jgi:hypothetical protein
MLFRTYEEGVKVIVVRLRLCGKTLAEINRTIGLKISNDSLCRWMTLYQNTRDVVRDPALYKPQGRPLAFSRDEAEFVLTALDEDPTLYLDEIQSHIEAMTGTRHPLATISRKLRMRLNLTNKVARTVHPAQSEDQRAEYMCEIGPFPSSYLVFVGK